jgi:hypothetical protein
MDWGWALVGAAGIEPATLGLEIRCSILLSYAPKIRQLQLEQWIADNQSCGVRLSEVPAQPQYRTASARLRVEPGRQLGGFGG